MRAPEDVLGVPTFLSASAHHVSGRRFEVVSRARLDTRQIVPFHRDARGGLHVGALLRERASRVVRGEGPSGLEPIGFDFRGVDETGDVLSYGRAVFSERARVRIDEGALVVPLPSVARSIGWATELALPLLLPVVPPDDAEHEVSWDGETHRIVFAPAHELRARLRTTPHDEVLALALSALDPPLRRTFEGPEGRALAARAWDLPRLTSVLREDPKTSGERETGLRGEALRFLRLSRVGDIEVATPATGASVAVLPWFVAEGEPWFLLWVETRASALERRARQPIFDLPVPSRYVNATGRYVDRARHAEHPLSLAEYVLESTFGAPIRVLAAEDLGTAEPAPSFGAELRRRLACAIDPDSVATLPDDVVVVSGRTLVDAVAGGLVRDPVIVAGLLQLGLDPFGAVRFGQARERRAFVDRMTEGSRAQRRLQSYSSIEAEQLGSKTYARVMLMLQHEYGLRIAYPARAEDRSFFKAAFRVFMAASRGDENRALQGLHWSHDAFHFAIGNLTLPPPEDFEAWFDSGDEPPRAAPHEGPAFEAYCEGLKAAEDEATFFSFWTLFEEQPSLVRHVPTLTFWAGLREVGVFDRGTARALYDDLAVRGVMPDRLAQHPRVQAREELRSLFEYIRGFRAYHLTDIHPAFDHASRDVWRGFFTRFGIYETDPARYVARVRAFDDLLAAQPRGLSPLAAMAADVRMDVALRVFDVTKALRLQRKSLAGANLSDAEKRAHRVELRRAGEGHVRALEAIHARLAAVREGVHDAELSSANERTFAALGALAAEVAAVRARIWDAASTWLPASVVEAERARELPR
jgi:hypothetical protein